MKEDEKLLGSLIRKYIDGTASGEEVHQLMVWIDSKEGAGMDEVLEACFEEEEIVYLQREGKAEEIFQAIVRSGKATVVAGPLKRKRWLHYAAAASIGLLILAGIGIYEMSNRQDKPLVITPEVQDMMPGRAGAVLTLANGKQIILDDSSTGPVTIEGNVTIRKDGTTLRYVQPDPGVGGNIINTIRTPVGRDYSLVLADGSMVWLNAGSSIRFPVGFSGKTRSVEITGEAYFEVAKNAAKPFEVSVGDMKVEVLGTNFNINAYKEEKSISTTLLEGSVRVVSGKQKLLLKPGQRARLIRANREDVNAENKLVLENTQDPVQTVSWKNGAFTFHETDPIIVLRQLARWYDVELEFPQGIPTERISGKMGKNLKLSEALFILKALGIRAELQNRKLVITQ
ncbi:MAG: FecR family protein [Pseudobacter sp.]|uniref:FecR family protein n=1 Tax=Pseudobacter sp. TaxID=2045420 RepID=UPI003F815A66